MEGGEVGVVDLEVTVAWFHLYFGVGSDVVGVSESVFVLCLLYTLEVHFF